MSEPADAVPDLAPPALEIPWQELSGAALTGVLEAWVLREGTDYGEVERDFASKVAELRALVERGEARLLFDPATRSVAVVPPASGARTVPRRRD